MITVYACAKINLTLEVTGRRGDGYHEIATVLQEVDLKDTLSFKAHRGLTLDCDIPDLEPSQNLAFRAAELLREEAGSRKGAAIRIKKRIPPAAGLGGGSSDGVATLKALNELWGLKLPASRLLELASKLGSDTAFFVHGGTALGEGRGDVITPLPPLSKSWVVLFKPPVAVPQDKTKSLYAALRPSHFSNGQHTRKAIEMLDRQGDVSSLPLFNVFEQVAEDVYAGLGRWRQRFLELGAADIHLAGSGPTLFSIGGNRAQAERLYRALVAEGLEAYLVQTVVRHE
jgi:4-diphosphocytidyl-2-C-methyl-D-erythritol kinase